MFSSAAWDAPLSSVYDYLSQYTVGWKQSASV